MHRFAITVATAVAVVAMIFAAGARAAFHPPISGFWTYCKAGVWAWHGATHYTSCPFARNVALGVRMSPEFGAYRLVGEAYSPVTHRTYVVNCVRRAYIAYRCTAGIQAIIWVG